ncbi:MAG: T9SS type A sorting domain-containing protein [Candidatus Jorgensenbacteria bacterium]
MARKGSSLFIGTAGGVWRIDDILTGVETPEETTLLTGFVLSQNYPNPFNPSTTIEFALPKSSLVTLKVMNLMGQEVAVLVSSELSAGTHRIEWNPSASSGQVLPSGIYFARLEANGFVATRKMLLLK